MISAITGRARTGRKALDGLVAAAARVGAVRSDSDDVRLRKATMVFSSALFIVAGLLWGLFYFLLDRPVAGAIPLGYSILTVTNVAAFAATRRYRLFRFVQLTLTLLLPFLLMVMLGGYVTGSAVIMWAFAAPLGALLFADLRYAHRWYLAFLVLVVLGLLIAGADPGFSDRLIVFFFAANIGGVSFVTFMTIRYFVGQKNRTLELLRQEREKSERLLLNVLPSEIAERLKSDGQEVIADGCEAVSVLFADVVGFTPLSAELPPEEMIGLLNDVFRYFDSLVARYSVEKIRTIGDNYMVAAGAPRPRADHAQVLARLALDMHAYVSPLVGDGGRRLQFRIGINSGPAIAGVIGQTKFHYDIWGDAVNTASRMESHGVPGKIHITRETMELIKSEFDCRRRGVIDVKGKGRMETWFVEGPLQTLGD